MVLFRFMNIYLKKARNRPVGLDLYSNLLVRESRDIFREKKNLAACKALPNSRTYGKCARYFGSGGRSQNTEFCIARQDRIIQHPFLFQPPSQSPGYPDARCPKAVAAHMSPGFRSSWHVPADRGPYCRPPPNPRACAGP